MSETKKYYWLKLKRDFFKRHDIRIIEVMPNGKDYILFYLKMLLESIDHEGELRFSETIPYNEEMLSVITNTNVDIVRSAMKIFIDLNMIDVYDDRTIYMNEVQRMIGSESTSAERVRRHRENRKALQSNGDALHCNNVVTKCNTEKEKQQDKNIIYIVELLNEKAGTKYKPTVENTQDVINARLAEGFTLDDFKTVIEKKCTEWLGTEWEKFLRPETLFGTKFESYLNAKVNPPKENTTNAKQYSYNQALNYAQRQYPREELNSLVNYGVEEENNAPEFIA